MPELPDVTVYAEALRPRVVGRVLSAVLMRSPSLLRTFDPPHDAAEGRRVVGVERLAKRIVLGLEGDLFLAIHLMIAGRLLWKEGRQAPKGKIDQAAFVFAGEPETDAASTLRAMATRGGRSLQGRPPAAQSIGFKPDATLVLTEASTQKRAALHVLQGRAALAALHPGGLEPLECTPPQFAAALTRENRTLKRVLTDQRILVGIGNAYSDEILFEARLSPVKLTSRLAPDEFERLHRAVRERLMHWTVALREVFGLTDGRPGRFPHAGEITAFRPDFRVHGKYGQPCTVCATPIQRIVRGDHETNYCAKCQNGGRILADRSLSRLLKDDWPRTVEELEA